MGEQEDEQLMPETNTASKQVATSVSPKHVDVQLSVWQAIWPALLFGTTTLSLNLVNKTVFSLYDYKAMLFLGFAGNFVTVCLLLAAHTCSLLVLRPISREHIYRLWPMALLGCGNSVVGFFGMRFVNLPMYLVLRRTTTLVTMVLEYVVQGRVATSSARAAVGVMMVGTVIAGWNDLTGTTLGYVIVLTQNMITGGNWVFMNKIKVRCQYIYLVHKRSVPTG
jgi:GDP-mannose transporter